MTSLIISAWPDVQKTLSYKSKHIIVFAAFRLCRRLTLLIGCTTIISCSSSPICCHSNLTYGSTSKSLTLGVTDPVTNTLSLLITAVFSLFFDVFSVFCRSVCIYFAEGLAARQQTTHPRSIAHNHSSLQVQNRSNNLPTSLIFFICCQKLFLTW